MIISEKAGVQPAEYPAYKLAIEKAMADSFCAKRRPARTRIATVGAHTTYKLMDGGSTSRIEYRVQGDAK